MTEQKKKVIIRQYILQNAGKTIDQETFANETGISEDDLDSYLSEYINSGNIKSLNGKYSFSSMYFYDYLNKCDLPEKSKDLVLKRIHGNTLQDIANEIGKTRETARLEEKNALKLIEENFTIKGKRTDFQKYLFLDEQLNTAIKNVKFDKDFYITVVERHPEFAGAKYFLAKYKKISDSPNVQINVINAISGNIHLLPKWFLQEVIDYYHPVIIENGAVFAKYDGDALTEILRLHGPFKTKDLMDIYSSKEYLLNSEDDEIEGYEQNKPNTEDGLRYFTYIYPLHSDVIRTGKHGELRYYDMQKYKNKIEETITSLVYPSEEIISKNQEEGKKGKINIKYVFRLNKDMLKKIDIHNEYELHSLMRRYEGYVPENISMKRIPMIQIR